ncbi:MAG: phosphotransferase [Phycisphaerae bacterium]|nr:phosphotransferase [Phycisphaerae bacterium]
MSTTFNCRSCQGAIQVEEQSIGLQVHCPHCQATVTVPTPGLPGAPTDSPAPLAGLANSVGLSNVTGQSALVGPDGRDLYGTSELAIVLSNYDLGVIKRIHPFNRGSRKAPKAVLETDTGRYLLKRRARGKDDPYKVALAHTLQLFLVSRQFPLPHLIGTRRENNSMLQLFDYLYEVFEYISGQPYEGNLDATFDAGRVLGLYHKLLLDFQSPYVPATGSYHDSAQVKHALSVVPKQIDKGQVDGEEAGELLGFISQSYSQAAQAAKAAGMDEWPMQIVHADWHPGNMLFLNNRVVAVIDYDSTRIQQRVTDLANGALQFSILGGADDPANWPDYLDETRFKRFVRGYEAATPISEGEIVAIPHLMIEALIAEAVLPVAATGSFGRIKGYLFLNTIARKVKWIQSHADQLMEAIRGG